ncbi:MAG: FG-GAP-like repeat-containing protein [Bacteroidota bacterium]|nr:FG-GAP-like repeat-containing protein [Bacteroidota bacterium]
MFRWPANSTLCFVLLSVLVLVGCGRETDRTWTPFEGYDSRSLVSPIGEGTGFTEVNNSIAFSNAISTSALVTNRHVVNGSGVAIGDVDRDGLPDVFLAGMEHRSTLHRNQGDWQFEDVTLRANLGLVNPRATGATFVDVDADGDLDLFVTSLGSGIQLFLNDGAGQFTDYTAEANLPQSGGATSVALADMDQDGDLDLYAGFYKEATVKDVWPPNEIAFERVVKQVADSFVVNDYWADEYKLIRQGDRLMRVELAEPDRVFFNDGTGFFTEVPFTEGLFLDEEGHPLRETPRDWTLAVRFQDFNGDGHQDLYVCNDFESPDHFWLGSAEGTFRAVSTLALRKTSQSTMSVAAADIDADGDVDIFLADMLSQDYIRRQKQHFVIPPEVVTMGDIHARPQEMQNMLLLNRSDTTFSEVARMSGVAATGWTWSSAFIDVDLDGLQDLLLTTGHAYDAMDADAQIAAGSSRRPWREVLLDFPDLDLPNIAFRNLGDARFEWVEEGWGLGVVADVAHGMAFADLDEDGDQDVIINRLDAPVGVFRNDAEGERILVRLRGNAPNPQGVGAVVQVTSENLPPQRQEILVGGLYLSSSDASLTFAYAPGAQIEVHWADGSRSVIEEVLPGSEYRIFQPQIEASEPSVVQVTGTMFTVLSIGLEHQESSYPDFDRQPLLPHKLSQRGPALAVTAMDSGGYEHLILGGGKGEPLRFIQNNGGRFNISRSFSEPSSGDHGGIVVFPGSDNVLAGMSNYERTPEDLAEDSKITRVSMQDGGDTSFTFGQESPGPLALGDFTGDGRLELFVGGHFMPGQYPVNVSSAIYRHEGGMLVRDDTLSAPFEKLGLVSGATAADFNGDGTTDLALATMWGPVHVFHNRGGGQLVRMTRALGLAEHTGWWNGVAPADFDGDGKIDLVATNWGQNHPYAQDVPLRAYYGDLDNNGSLDILEVQHIPELDAFGLVRDFRTLTHALPTLRQHIRTYEEFATSSAMGIFGPVLSEADYHEVTEWQTMVFLNRESHYEAVPLAAEAQWSPAFAPVPGDFNGDGRTDLFLSQNFFAVPSGNPRLDSGLGLLLLADESHQLVPQPAQASGIYIYGSQRAAVRADFDRDGRMDLAVAQNAGPVVLLQNRTAAKGLRVELRLFGANQAGVGGNVRAEYRDGSLGPSVPIVAGSGYWSQSSAEPILAPGDEIVKVHVNWPDGTATVTAVPAGAPSMLITRE